MSQYKGTERGGVYIEGTIALLVLIPFITVAGLLIIAYYQYSLLQKRQVRLGNQLSVSVGTILDAETTAGCVDLLNAAHNQLAANPATTLSSTNFSVVEVGNLSFGTTSMPLMKIRATTTLALIGATTLESVFPIETRHSITTSCP